MRKALIGTNAATNTINVAIPLNRCSFFNSFKDHLMPNSRTELRLTLESDANLIWRAGGEACRVIVTNLQLLVPKIQFNSKEQSLYMSDYVKPKKWVYLRENVNSSSAMQQKKPPPGELPAVFVNLGMFLFSL